MSASVKIYALRDPLSHNVKYVGKTGGLLAVRLAQHMARATQKGVKATARDKWIADLLARGMRPMIELIETVTDDWQAREIYWIKYYKLYNLDAAPMTNATLGGRGVRRKA